MKAFMNQDFLLSNETARTLYHTYAEQMPIFDYHNHLSAQEIYEDKGLSLIHISFPLPNAFSPTAPLPPNRFPAPAEPLLSPQKSPQPASRYSHFDIQ